MQYCSTCLSSGRRLTPLSNLNQAVTAAKLLDVNINLTEVYICWECERTFCRIIIFKAQIVRAQETLKIWNRNVKTNKKIKPLSRLTSTTKDSYDTILLEEYSAKHSCITKENYEVDCFDDNVWEEFKKDENCNEPNEEDGSFDKIPEDENQLKETMNDIQKEPPAIDDRKICAVNQNMKSPSRDKQKTKKNKYKAKLNSDAKFTGKSYITYNEIDSEGADVEKGDYKEIGDVPDFKITKDEENFTITKMSMQELYNSREVDRNATVYKRCPFKCTKCIIGYYKEHKYERHLKEKHYSGPKGKRKTYTCTICEVRFTRRDAVQSHYEKHFRRYSCRLCDYSHHKLAAMLAHKSNEHDKDVLYSCGLCDKSFTLMSKLRYHNESCHKEKAKCEICGKVTTTKYNLKIHMLVHKPSLVQCGECGVRVRGAGLAAHRRAHAAPAAEAAYCAPCGRQFASAQLYKRHLLCARAHAGLGGRTHQCTYCDMAFTDKFSLTRHVASRHLNLYPYKCPVCDKGFIRKDKLKIHIMERHEGISRPKDKICNYCGKGFKMKAGLRIHIRTHTGERPYCCAHCPAAFAQASTLKTHVKALHKNLDKNLE